MAKAPRAPDARTFGQDLMRGEHVVGQGNGSRMAFGGGDIETIDGRPSGQRRAQEYEGGTAVSGTGTSIFDPVLCELVYRWFSPPGGVVLDPFAGGSVRGIVACKLGRRYVGHELRAEQVEANRLQAEEICPGDDLAPLWIEGDSRLIAETCADVDADLVFSCPPYADLEVYSDDPADLSTMPYADFLAAYREIIAAACARLLPDSFACFVVGEVRDERGNYRNFVGDTVEAFRAAGLAFYNEAILLTAIGSLPIRVGRQFAASRKLGKTHQNVLVFVKGDGKRAAARCGQVEIDDSLLDAADDADAGQETADDPTRRSVKVSAAMANLKFNGCDPEYIRTTCHASCCQSSTSPTGTIITVHPREVPAIADRGGVVIDGLLQPRPGEKRCPFKTQEDLCGIHFTPDKPFGCIASPFTLNTHGTLIVRNRYRLLRCYDDGNRRPAYVAFRASLDLIFGEDEAERICQHLEAGGGDIMASMPAENFETLRTNDAIKHASKSVSSAEG